MIKALSWRFASNWDTFTCWLSKDVPKRGFSQSGMTKFFTVCNFGNILAMTIILFFKMFKIFCRLQKWNKQLIFCFSDNCICIGNCKFSQSSTGYLPSAVNELTKTWKILRNTRWGIFQINFSQNDAKHRINVLLWRLRKVLGHFHMLTVNACYETGVSTEWSDKNSHSQ